TYKWKSDNTAVATVNSNGKITAKAEGTVNITVETANGSKANCKVTVKKAPKSVSLNKTAITLGIGEEFDFNSSLSDGSASYSTVYSSSNPSVVSVKAGGGLATGKKTGTATITVKTYNGKTASCKVTVKKAPTSISLNKSSVTLGIGDYIDLNSKMPSGEASRVVTYTSSDKSIAAVNGSGLVNAKKLGTVTITAKTYNGKTTTCKVTVKNAPSSVSLNKSKITIGIGETFDFNSSIPSGTASYSRSFYSYNSNIVSINKAGGLATGKSVGSATIRVTTHNDKNAYADVTVKKAPTSVSLNKTSATLGVGEKIDLNSKLPSGEASRVVTYTTADKSIATVDGSGVVTAKKTGTVIITAKTYNGKTATCKITVKKAPTGVSLNKTSVSLKVGEKVDLNSKMPSGQASRVVTYTSADTSIATVDGSGVVTAKKKGTAIITAKTYNGKTATCRVIVR
ncbi:MAG: Ig domain-containing protein, partial [Clostridia bacterium]|nr:Ig domain-containing protein [Clostridia bacterium]